MDLFKYRYPLIGAALVLLVSLGSWKLYQFYENTQNKKAEEEVYQKKIKLLKAEKAAGGDSFSENFYYQKKAEDFSAFSKEALEYKRFLMSQKKPRPAHWLGALELSYLLIKYQQTYAAVELLSHLQTYSQSKSWIYQAMLLQLGSLLMDKGGFTRALNIFSSIVSHPEAQALHHEALFKSAICYESLGRPDKAQEIYSSLEKNGELGLYKERALNYDRLLKIKQKLGTLGKGNPQK